MKLRWKVLALTTILVLTASFAIGGYEKAKVTKAEPKADLYNEVELFADAISILRSDYVDEVEPKKLIYGALKGMLGSLDDFSQFMTPEEFKDIRVETKGEFGGVGMELSSKNGIPTVIAPIDGTPAEAAGIKSGDRIVKIDGTITRNMTMDEAVSKMRGKPGTTVALAVWREKDEKILEFAIKRAVIKIDSIRKTDLLDDKTGYIRLVEFQENTAGDLEAALKKLEGQGMDALILDLRNNPGGILESAVTVCEKFLPKDTVIVSLKPRNPDQNTVFKASGISLRPDYPLIVMVNEGSASASEIVAGAVQDNKKGIVLGTKTFGKASVQSVIPLKDGSAVKLTTASYMTPKGRMIKDHGIVPDVIIERIDPVKKKTDAQDIYEKVEEKKEPVANTSVTKEMETDNQLQTAVNLMKAIKVYKRAKT